MQLEDDDHVQARDWYASPEAGLSRWIHEQVGDDGCLNRNACPGCGCCYLDLVKSWTEKPVAWLADSGSPVPRDMVTLCMVCLHEKYKVTRSGEIE
jgi:hypothetical protein